MPDEPQKLQEAENWQERAQEYLDGWKRERAQFENYKKEEAERNQEMEIRVKRVFSLKILPILDSLELALRNTPEDAKKNEWFMGYTYIQKQFEDFLGKEGIGIIGGEGEVFDPRLHEAIEAEKTEVSDDKAQPQKDLIVKEVLQRGYRIGNIVIRPARVRVARIDNSN